MSTPTIDPAADHPISDHPISDYPTSDSPLVRFLYPAPARRTVGGIFKWWEKRRLAYNLIVGAGGAVALAGAAVTSRFIGFPLSLGELWDPVIPVAIWANLCYTLGPLTESLLHRIWGHQVRPVGPHLFRAGLILSVGVTFVIPAIAMGVFFVVSIVRLILGIGA